MLRSNLGFQLGGVDLGGSELERGPLTDLNEAALVLGRGKLQASAARCGWGS